MAILRHFLIIAGRGEQLFFVLFLAQLLLIAAVFPQELSAEEELVSIELTESEHAWLTGHPTIRIGIMDAWPPMDYVDNKGRPQGIGVEFIRALNKRLDNRLEIVSGPWSETYKAVKEKQLDALMDITPRSDREAFFHFTEPYIEVPHLIFSRKDAPKMGVLADLAGMTVGVEKGFFIVKVLHEKYPQVRVREYATTSDALDALSKGEVDAYVGNRAVARYIIENELITNLNAQGKISETSSINAIGVRKDQPILRDILQKGLDDISPQEYLQLITPFSRLGSSERSVFTRTLSFEERVWLSEHSKINIGVMDAWPPMSFINKNGIPQGIGIDYLEAINRRLGGILVPEPAPFKQNYNKVKNKQLDGIMDITPKPERELFFEFTKPYIAIPHAYVGRRDGAYYDSAEDLNGKIVALEKGYYNVKFFRDNYPQVMVREYSSTSEALGAVSRGEADAYAGNRAVVMYLIEQELLFNLSVQGRMDKPPVELNIGVRKDWSILAQILDRAIADITPEEVRQIHKRWVGELTKVDQELILELTEEQRSWLDKQSIVRLGVDPDWPPVEWIDENNRYHGITSEYIGLISNMLAIEVSPVQGLSWVEVLKGAEQGEIDVIPALVATAERRKYLNFTSPYLEFPFVIFTREDASFVTELSDLYGKRVAVEEGYVSYDYLQRDHPRIKLTTYETTKEILQALSLGEIDAYVGNLTVAGYLIKKTGLTNIKVAAPTPYIYDLSIGVRKDWPELIPILENALSKIDEKQRNDIRQKWLKLHYDVGVDYALVKRLVLGAAMLILITLAWMTFVQRQKRVLREAKAETDKANEAYLLANSQLMEANIKLRELDRLKSMFIASMSHELRTPLNSIIGFSGLLLQGISGDLNSKQKDSMERIFRSGKHLLGLISDVIDISKIEAGHIDAFYEYFSLKQVVEESIETIRPQADAKGLKLELNADSWPEMNTDYKRLLQCLLNYLSNAVKFSESGKVTLSVTVLEDWVELRVSDTGIGIPEEDMPKLFEAFERLDTHLRVKSGGTGLGLYLTKKITEELLHGHVSVESCIDEGSTFGLKIPIDAANGAQGDGHDS